MGLKATTLAENTASVMVQIDKESMTVVYYPGRAMSNTSISVLAKLSSIKPQEMLKSLEAVDQLLCSIIKEWELLEDDGVTIFPLIPGHVATLPSYFRLKVLTAIMGDIGEPTPMPQIRYLN